MNLYGFFLGLTVLLLSLAMVDPTVYFTAVEIMFLASIMFELIGIRRAIEKAK